MVTDLLNAGPAAVAGGTLSEGMDCSELATEDRFEYRFPKAPVSTEILHPNWKCDRVHVAAPVCREKCG